MLRSRTAAVSADRKIRDRVCDYPGVVVFRDSAFFGVSERAESKEVRGSTAVGPPRARRQGALVAGAATQWRVYCRALAGPRRGRLE